MKPRALWVLFALPLAFSACADGDEDARATGDPDRERPSIEVGEPYPYSEPAPPEEPTPIDGSFTRTISVHQAGGPPIYCRRCAPWRLDAGKGQLRFDRGRFVGSFEPIRVEVDCRSEALVEEECKHPPGFNVSGHFRVEGDRVELFNDPNCIGTTGVYRWTLEGEILVLEEVADECPYVRLRAKYLTAAPWHLSS